MTSYRSGPAPAVLLLAALLVGLTIGPSPAPAAAAGTVGLPGLLAESEPPRGSAEAWGKDGRLRPGCGDYRFGYAVDYPEEQWMLELVFRDRQGRAVASAKFEGPADPLAQRSTMRLCRAAVKAGTFTVRGVLTTFEDGYTERRVPVSRFRLRR